MIASYVEFIITPEMVNENPGLTAGTYDLNDGIYYEENKATLIRAFGDGSSACEYNEWLNG